jgi:hypothetical protein
VVTVVSQLYRKSIGAFQEPQLEKKFILKNTHSTLTRIKILSAAGNVWI